MADIHSKVPTDEFRSNFDRIFGAKSEPEAEQLIAAGVNLRPSAPVEPTIVVGEFGMDIVKFFSGGEVALEISNGGFYVRGVKVEQGDGEAEAVYKAFKEWLPFKGV